jgi:hypothetical protein
MNHSIKSVLALSAFALAQNAWAQAVTPTSVVVCRERQCAAASQTMTREFLYNQLVSFFENNVGQPVLLCEADQVHRVCYENGLEFNVMAGITPAKVFVESAKILDVKPALASSALEMSFDYEMSLNNDARFSCQAAVSRMKVSSADTIRIETSGFNCDFTAQARTLVNMTYSIDYIDLDYGLIGAHYVIGTSQASKGGGVGYALLRFNSLQDNPNSFAKQDLAEYEKLKEENKLLKEDKAELSDSLEQQKSSYEKLQEENKTLQEDNAGLNTYIKQQQSSYEKTLKDVKKRIPPEHDGIGKPVYMNSDKVESEPSFRQEPKKAESMYRRSYEQESLNVDDSVNSDSVPAGTVQIFPIGMK